MVAFCYLDFSFLSKTKYLQICPQWVSSTLPPCLQQFCVCIDFLRSPLQMPHQCSQHRKTNIA